jgi:hypothetical protein
MTQLDQNILQGLDNQALASPPFSQRLALWLFKVTALANFGLIMFCLGYFSTLYSDGWLIEIPGLVSYWIDFGGAQ